MKKQSKLLGQFLVILLFLGTSVLKAESNGPCAIESMAIEFLDCNSDGTYNVEIYYTVLNPVGDTLSLFINSEHHADYIIGGSITVNNVEPSDIFETDIFYLCMKADEDCYYSLDFEQPECLCDGPCSVEDIQVLILECNEFHNTYTAQVFYTITNPGHELVYVTINGVYYGEFPIGESIIIDGITPRPNSDYDIIQICAADECCGLYEYLQEDCDDNGEDCNIYDIEIVDYVCSTNSDGYAAIWLNYEVDNPLDSIIWINVNGNEMGGWLVGETISFDVSSDAANLVITLFFDGTDCSETIEIPNVCPGDCDWDGMELDGFKCFDGGYFTTLYYNVNNPPNDEVFLVINGAGLGDFPVNEPISWEAKSSPQIEVFMYFYSEATDTICTITQIFDNPCFECNSGCLEGQLDYTYECLGTGAYSLNISPTLECGADTIPLLITVNNQITIPYNSNENWIFDVIENDPDTDILSVEVCYENHPECCVIYALTPPPCDNNLPCSVDSVMVYLNCVGDNSYYMEGFAVLSNPGNDFIDVFLDSTLVGFYEIDENGFAGIYSGKDNLFVLEPNTSYDITVCVNDKSECCTTYTAVTEDCNVSCECLEFLGFEVIATECGDDNTYLMEFEYDFLCDTVSIQINNGPVEFYYGEGASTIEGIQAADEPLVTICLANNPDCCIEYDWIQPQCFNGDDPVEQLVSISLNNSEMIVDTKEYSQVGLIDINGRKVRSHGNKAMQHRINTTGLTTGVYLVNIIEPTRISTQKVFISN